jgi:hypothetical protein
MPGQTIAIMAAGGTRKVKATVPMGLKPGDTFLVRLATPIHTEPASVVSTLGAPPPPLHHSPPRREQQSIPAPPRTQSSACTPDPHFAQSLDEWLTPTPEIKKPIRNTSMTSYEQHLQHQHRDPPSYAARGFIAGREAPEDYYPPPYGSEFSTMLASKETEGLSPVMKHEELPLRQKLLLIQVPIGMSPGTMLQVEIPGENRTVTAQIPPYVESFYVAYTPQPRVTTNQPQQQPNAPPPVQQHPSPPAPPPQVQSPPPVTMPPPQQQPQQQQSPSPPVIMSQQQQHAPPPKEYQERQEQHHKNLEVHSEPAAATKPKRKLLLVRVPPNTAQGATLHVSIPDEPGRILAAIVPPGNLTEFHVSYEPRKQQQHQPSRQVKQPQKQQRQQSSSSYENRHEIQQIQYYGDDSLGVAGTSSGERAYERYESTY